MSILSYTTVDRIFTKLYREINDSDIQETDVIEWIGEALGFMKTRQLQDQLVTFLKVTDYEAKVPCNFNLVLQLAMLHSYDPSCCEDNKTECEDSKEEEECLDITDSNTSNADILNYVFKSMRSDRNMIDMTFPWQYLNWTSSDYYKHNFCNIRLANHTFFNSIVCKEKSLYEDTKSCGEEYTIVGNIDRKFRFSFREGFVALSYLGNKIDPETGYPYIPDTSEHITAITYYVKWKIAERYSWEGREGFTSISDRNEARWLKYISQAKNLAKMPNTIDEYQNLLEQTHYLIPDHQKYYNHFSNLGRSSVLNFQR